MGAQLGQRPLPFSHTITSIAAKWPFQKEKSQGRLLALKVPGGSPAPDADLAHERLPGSPLDRRQLLQLPRAQALDVPVRLRQTGRVS